MANIVTISRENLEVKNANQSKIDWSIFYATFGIQKTEEKNDTRHLYQKLLKKSDFVLNEQTKNALIKNGFFAQNKKIFQTIDYVDFLKNNKITL